MRKKIRIILAILVLLITGFAAFVWYSLQARPNPQPLPSNLFAVESAEGQKMLARANFKADYAALASNYEPQELVSFCGVASSVTVLNALGKKTNQSDFFTDDVSDVKSRFSVMFGGMALSELTNLLEKHNTKGVMTYASDSSLEEFRNILKRNLSNPENYLLVNYQREVLEQGTVGHISPLGAYDNESDYVLIMDTAAHKYPPTWVPVSLLFDAMNTADASSGVTRGYLEVSKN